ncbi:MAG: DegT/DnrJ/EryC1/StrS aminotransferase family protein [Candidatus Aenigmarchaeota archaeon]|nr:DegT/DnrJ/EryC1/StrS aminotransferase family protein [Candidatus Aenigmarchaeota archaeon]
MIPIGKPIIGKEEIDSVISVLSSGALAQGKFVQEFENILKKYCSRRYAIAVNSGTAALHLSVLALGIKGKAAVPDFTFGATAASVKLSGGEPVFLDVDKKTFNMDPAQLENVIKDVEIAMPVSLFGQPYDVDEINKMCRENGVKIISDNAQSIGAEWNGKRNFGDGISILSFYPTKNITTTEGGAVLTDDKDIAEACMLLRNHGQKERYSYEFPGYNYRMTEVAAVIGLEQLKKLDGFIRARTKNAKILSELIGKYVEIPFVDKHCKHVFNQFTIKTDKRETLIKNLKSNDIGYGIYYPSPLHSQKAFLSKSNCPVTETLCKKVLSLPIHPSVTENDLHKIADVVKKVV